jgi:hypothetical protein
MSERESEAKGAAFSEEKHDGEDSVLDSEEKDAKDAIMYLSERPTDQAIIVDAAGSAIFVSTCYVYVTKEAHAMLRSRDKTQRVGFRKAFVLLVQFNMAMGLGFWNQPFRREFIPNVRVCFRPIPPGGASPVIPKWCRF